MRRFLLLNLALIILNSGEWESYGFVEVREEVSSRHSESPHRASCSDPALSSARGGLPDESCDEVPKTMKQLMAGSSVSLFFSTDNPTVFGFFEDQRASTMSPKLVYEETQAVNRKGILRDYGVAFAYEQTYRLFRSNVKTHLDGEFFDDYLDSITHIKEGFWDGDTWYWNVVMHPISGGISYHLARTRGASPLESFLWGVVYSVHWELSPIGQAGVGNNRVSPVDLIVTPTAGVAWIMMEDWLDSKIDKVPGEGDQKILRSLLPAKMFSNLIRFRVPWNRHPPD